MKEWLPARFTFHCARITRPCDGRAKKHLSLPDSPRISRYPLVAAAPARATTTRRADLPLINRYTI